MLKLNMTVPSTLAGKLAISQEHLPCICWIGEGGFQVRFSDPLFSCIGYVDEWDQKQIDMVAPAYGGSNYTHYNFAKVTLLPADENNEYTIIDLSFSYSSSGWVDVIVDGLYAEVFASDEDW